MRVDGFENSSGSLETRSGVPRCRLRRIRIINLHPISSYALIGWPLGHSFSKKYFSEKFIREGIADARYELFPLEHIADLPQLLKQHPDLRGLNVTIPHKETVIPFLDELDETARKIGAVNCIEISANGRLKGYNTDAIGFELSLKNLPELSTVDSAYILGTGGASKSVAYVLRKLGIPFKFVSRLPVQKNEIGYESIPAAVRSSILINCTPLGTFPNVREMPPLPIEIFKPGILVYDLVYNPGETLLLQEAKARGCIVRNGLEMLYLQAEAAWEIWLKAS